LICFVVAFGEVVLDWRYKFWNQENSGVLGRRNWKLIENCCLVCDICYWMVFCKRKSHNVATILTLPQRIIVSSTSKIQT